jgi:type I restriction enzyme M protein
MRIRGSQVFSVARQKWVQLTPEEKVRQEYLRILVNEYGYTVDQIDEEREVTGRGSGHARADFVIWRTIQDKADGKNPLIVVECKADNVTIKPDDYGQGDNYSRLCGARFFVTHNSRETKYWRVRHERMPKTLEEISNIPHADASNKEIEELISKLKTFKEDEFADLLHQCHNVIRNREKLDPAAAFDEIAKILFVKVYVERELRAKRQRQATPKANSANAQRSRTRERCPSRPYRHGKPKERDISYSPKNVRSDFVRGYHSC